MNHTANWLSNGLGGQSMFLLYLAGQKIIPATLSITADTDSEVDRVCSDGRRMDARNFWETCVKPYAEAHDIEPLFIRSVDKNGEYLPGPLQTLKNCAGRGSNVFEEMIKGMHVPMFTCDKSKGRLRQSCTDKLKIRAINQEAKRRGISLLRNAIGYHAAESHRIKARFLKDDGGFGIYKPQVNKDGLMRDILWLEHYYPCVDLNLDREAIRARLQQHGIPYLITSECDCCPHQNYARWIMHTPEVLKELADLEARFNGKLFFTDKRIPLLQAIEAMRQQEVNRQQQTEMSFGCENGAYCGL